MVLRASFQRSSLASFRQYGLGSRQHVLLLVDTGLGSVSTTFIWKDPLMATFTRTIPGVPDVQTGKMMKQTMLYVMVIILM